MRAQLVALWICTLVALPVARATDATAPSSQSPAAAAAPAEPQVEAVDPASAKAQDIYRHHQRELIATLSRGNSPHDWALAALLGSLPHVATQKPAQDSGNLLHQATAALPDDTSVQWMALLASGNTSREYAAALQALERLEPDNAAVWVRALEQAKDQPAIDAALTHMAASTRYNDHRADLLRALLDAHQRYPLPGDYYAFADPSEATVKDVAPYLSAMIAVSAFSNPAWQPLMTQCRIDPVNGKNAAHAAQCDAIGRMLARHSTTYISTRIGFALLRIAHAYKDEDVRSARGQNWIFHEYQALQSELFVGRDDDAVPDPDRIAKAVRMMRAAITDQIETGNEIEANRQALVRAGKSLTPPADWVDTQSPFSPERLRAEEERATKERQRAALVPPNPASRTAAQTTTH